MAQVNGTLLDDLFAGTEEADVIVAEAGNDTIYAAAVNHPPSLNATESPLMPAVVERDEDPQGVTIAQLIADGSIGDPDGAIEAIAVTGFDTSRGDRATQRISFTWNTSDAYAIYLDGVATKTGTGYLTGHSIGTGTRTVTFNPVGGATGDMRIYDRVLFAAEVQATARTTVSEPHASGDPVLNWQVEADGSVIDASGGASPVISAGKGKAPTATVLQTATALDDLINGGDGADTVVRAGKLSDHTIAIDATIGAITAADQRAVQYDGTDTITGVENLIFSRGTLTPSYIFEYRPSRITLSSAGVAEQSVAGTVVGSLVATVPDAGDTITFRLAGGDGHIAISGFSPVVAKPLDYETASTRTVTIRAPDSQGLTFDQSVTITVSDVNQAPTGIALSATMVSENASAGTVIGTLSGTDPDAGQSATLQFSLASPSGHFEINGNQLVVKPGALLDYEWAKTLLVTVRATDAGGLTFDKNFAIGVTNVVEATLQTLQYTGSSANRVDMFFIGDGYTATDLAADKLTEHVNDYLDYLFGDQALTDPFTRYENFFNIYEVEVASLQGGADDPNNSIYVNTALNATYNYDGVTDRLLYFSNNLADQYIAEALDGQNIGREMRYGLVNSTKYGGGGGTYGVFAAGNGSAFEIALHEIGHSFAHLADEYSYGRSATYTGSEPGEINVTTDPTGAKWQEWLGYVDPLLGTVGAYEGGYYSKYGIYRPTLNSKMNNLKRPFDPIGREAFIHEFYKYADPLDGWDADAGTLSSVRLLSVDTIDPAVIQVDWTIAGTTLTDVGEQLDLDALGYTYGTYTITARAYDDTPWVRGDRSDLEQTVTWTIVNDYRLAGTTDADNLTGNDNAQEILGKEGNDSISGLGGDDILIGDEGNDILLGDEGNDILWPGHDDDYVDGGAGIDTISYPNFGSTMVIDLSLTVAQDTGGGEWDTIVNVENAEGGRGNDVLSGNATSNVITGAAGLDMLDGAAGNDTVDGGDDNDTLRYQLEQNAGAADTYRGGNGIDTLYVGLTAAEWADPQVQQQLAMWLQHLANAPKNPAGEIAAGPGLDSTLMLNGATLNVSMLEQLAVAVDGTTVDHLAPSFRAGDLDAVVTEDESSPTLQDTGSIQFYDLNWSDAHSLGVSPLGTSLDGTLQAVLSNPAMGDGQGAVQWTYLYSNALAQSLGEGVSTSEQFVVTITDSTGRSLARTLTATVAGVNDLPVAVADGFGTAEDTPLVVPAEVGVLANDGDPDGDALRAVLVTNPSHGALAMAADGSFTYAPTANYYGVDSFTYRPSDGTANGNVATVTIDVTPVNDVPALASVSLALSEGQTVTLGPGNFAITDPDDAAVTLTVSTVTGGYFRLVVAPGTPITGFTSAQLSAGLVQFVDDGNEAAPAFSVTANDGKANSNTLAATIGYTPVNDAPLAVADAYDVANSTPLNVAGPGVLANDSDAEGHALTAQLVSVPTNGTLTLAANGSFQYTPNAGFAGSDAFEYRASDGAAVSNTVTVRLTVAGAGNVINGTDAANTLVGTAGDERINGLGGNDLINGAGGNDTLDGGTGADTMAGGTGNDTFIVERSTDIVVEALNAGTDLVLSSARYTLPANVENLTLTGLAAIAGTGNTLPNVITGNDGANNLRGQAGNDTLYGGNGNDTVDGGGGNDVLYGGLDNDRLLGGGGNDSLNGKEGNDRLEGGSGADGLIGGNGVDWIDGGTGNDSLYGGADVSGLDGFADTFVFNTALGASNRDTIVGFEAGGLGAAGVDKIGLATTVFAAILGGPTAGLDASEFRASPGGNPVDANDFILFVGSPGTELEFAL